MIMVYVIIMVSVIVTLGLPLLTASILALEGLRKVDLHQIRMVSLTKTMSVRLKI